MPAYHCLLFYLCLKSTTRLSPSPLPPLAASLLPVISAWGQHLVETRCSFSFQRSIGIYFISSFAQPVLRNNSFSIPPFILIPIPSHITLIHHPLLYLQQFHLPLSPISYISHISSLTDLSIIRNILPYPLSMLLHLYHPSHYSYPHIHLALSLPKFITFSHPAVTTYSSPYSLICPQIYDTINLHTFSAAACRIFLPYLSHFPTLPL